MMIKKKKITQKECHNQDETVKDEVIILQRSDTKFKHALVIQQIVRQAKQAWAISTILTNLLRLPFC